MQKRKTVNWILVISIIVVYLTLSACSGTGDPAIAIENYIQALSNKELDLMINHSCASWEAVARTEYDSFATVETRLEGLACQTISVDSDTAPVECQGAIIATYGEEDQELNLANNRYLAILEGGDWRMCGYE